MTAQVDAISNLEVFQGLPVEALQDFGQYCIDRSFGRGEMIFFPGDERGRVFLVLDGEVKVYRSAEGRKIVLQALKPGDFFGDLSLVHEPYPLAAENYAQSTTPLKVCVISTLDLRKLLDKHPALSMILLTTLRNRLHQAESKIKDLALSTAETRIINELIRHAIHHSEAAGGYYQIEERLTHQQVAEMAGVTRETVTKALQQLQDSGFIEYSPERKLRLNQHTIINDCLGCIKPAQTVL